MVLHLLTSRTGAPLGESAQERPFPPKLVTSRDARRSAVGLGIQLGAFSWKAAPPPLISFGLSSEEHFKEALEVAQRKSPLEGAYAVDESGSLMQAEASHPTLTPHWVFDVICPLNPAATSVFPART